MWVGDWIILGVLAVLVAFGILVVRRTRYLQKRQYKIILINEIIDWASEIVKSIRMENVPVYNDIDEEAARKRVLNNRFFHLYGLEAKAEYMNTIAARFPELPGKIAEVRLNMKELSDVFLESLDGNVDDYGCALDNRFIRLEISAEEVIEFAIQLKNDKLV